MMNWHAYRFKHAFVGGSSSYVSDERVEREHGRTATVNGGERGERGGERGHPLISTPNPPGTMSVPNLPFL